VILSAAKEQPPDTRDARRAVRPADVWRVGHQFETGCQFFGEERWRRESVLAPPGVNSADVSFRLRRGEDRQAHR
jgi:hypothetical protein